MCERGHNFFVRKDQVMNSFIDILFKRRVCLLADSGFFQGGVKSTVSGVFEVLKRQENVNFGPSLT